jgi:hypothetical protein
VHLNRKITQFLYDIYNAHSLPIQELRVKKNKSNVEHRYLEIAEDDNPRPFNEICLYSKKAFLLTDMFFCHSPSNLRHIKHVCMNSEPILKKLALVVSCPRLMPPPNGDALAVQTLAKPYGKEFDESLKMYFKDTIDASEGVGGLFGMLFGNMSVLSKSFPKKPHTSPVHKAL